MSENYFAKLNAVNVNNHTEQKNGLTYLSWAWAWAEVKKLFPDAIYTIYENDKGWFYHTDGKTCWVKTGVTVNGIEHIEYLPVMDYRNKSIYADKVTSFDVNTAIQRSLTKACARHGLGLYIYAGEDLPEDDPGTMKESKDGKIQDPIYCADCGNEIVDTYKKNGEPWEKSDVVSYSTRRFKRPLCPSCQRKAFDAEKTAEKQAKKQAEEKSAALEQGELSPGDAECPVCHKIQHPKDGLSGYETIVRLGGMCLECYRKAQRGETA